MPGGKPPKPSGKAPAQRPKPPPGWVDFIKTYGIYREVLARALCAGAVQSEHDTPLEFGEPPGRESITSAVWRGQIWEFDKDFPTIDGRTVAGIVCVPRHRRYTLRGEIWLRAADVKRLTSPVKLRKQREASERRKQAALRHLRGRVAQEKRRQGGPQRLHQKVEKAECQKKTGCTDREYLWAFGQLPKESRYNRGQH
jgi:hypothetical protein